MANWLERAKREIQETHCRPTAKTDETEVSAVTAVPQPCKSEISRASNGGVTETVETTPETIIEELSPRAWVEKKSATIGSSGPSRYAPPFWRITYG